MIIKILVENTKSSKDLKNAHGLSLYIETDKHKLLFDLGPKEYLINNAIKMNINIEDIDTVIISHGHFDHGGALKAFMEKNRKAKIYIKESAFGSYYLSLLFFKVYVGLDKSLKSSERFVFTKDLHKIDDELQIFSNITEHKYTSGENDRLYKKEGKKYINDTFEHEQNLIITEGNNNTLIAGCAHNGIYNILTKAEKITGTNIKTVVGGFHLFQLPLKKSENIDYLKELSRILKTKPTKFYTCHCTGEKPYEILHQEMGDQINHLSTGSIIEL